MTEAEKRTLFEGCMPSTRAAIRLDNNEMLFEACWLATDFAEFMTRLEHFAIGLGLSAYRFYPDQSPKLTALIAADVRRIVEKIGWAWTMQHVEVRGRA